MSLSCLEFQDEETGLFSIGTIWRIDPNGQNLSVIVETLSFVNGVVHIISPNATIPERVILSEPLVIGRGGGVGGSGMGYFYEVREDYSGYLFVTGLQQGVLDDPLTIRVSSEKYNL